MRSCYEKSCESCASLWPIIRNLRFHSSSVSWRPPWRFTPISVHPVRRGSSLCANLPTAAVLGPFHIALDMFFRILHTAIVHTDAGGCMPASAEKQFLIS